MNKKRFTAIIDSLPIGIAMVLLIVVVVHVCWFALTAGFGFEESSAVAVEGLADAVIAGIAAIFIVVQIYREARASEKSSSVEQAQFILEYNKTFIQDEKMTRVESLLEEWSNGCIGTDELLGIVEKDTQPFVNYLVYLEGFATVVRTGVLKLESVDALMAYRFFLAMNNPALQAHEIFEYPEYYSESIALYGAWKKYRMAEGEQVLLSRYGLDRWRFYESFTGADGLYARHARFADDLDSIARLIYQTDPYIYPAAFGDESNAVAVLSELMPEGDSFFSLQNIYIAFTRGQVAGIAVLLNDAPGKTLPDSLCEQRESAKDVRERYFDSVHVDEDCMYLACLCVSDSSRGKGVGTMLLNTIAEDYPEKDILLDVLADNRAVSLYKRCGYVEVERKPGYSFGCEPESVIVMRLKR